MVFWDVMLFSLVDRYLFPHSAHSSTLNMEGTGVSKVLVRTYQTTWCHMPGDPDLNLYIHCYENLRSQIVHSICQTRGCKLGCMSIDQLGNDYPYNQGLLGD
jgi:hypothetical protein